MNADEDDDIAVIYEDEPSTDAYNKTVQLVNADDDDDFAFMKEDEPAADPHKKNNKTSECR